MRIFLTGATGLLGNNLLRRLIQDRHQVSVLVRPESDPRPLTQLNAEQISGDLNRPADFLSAIHNVDVVINCAAVIQLGWSRKKESYAVNVAGTQALVEFARRKSIRLIHISTVDALAASTPTTLADESCLQPAKSNCTYVVTKRQAEQIVSEQVKAGHDGIILNPGFMVGPWDWKPSSGQMMLAIAKHFIPMAPGGGFSVVDVRDVVEGVVLSMTNARAGDRYILAGENMTYYQLWKMMAQVMKRRPPRRGMPNWIAWCAGKSGDLAGTLLGRELSVNSAATGLGQMYHWYSSQHAIDRLGYRVGPVRTAVEDAWKWFQAYGYVNK